MPCYSLESAARMFVIDKNNIQTTKKHSTSFCARLEWSGLMELLDGVTLSEAAGPNDWAGPSGGGFYHAS